MRWEFIDEITECDEETFVRGHKTFPLQDEWHQDHFPGKAIVPGVLQIETGANFLGKLVLFRSLKEKGVWTAPLLLKTQECTFKGMILPGDKIEVEMKIDKWTRLIVRGSGELKVNGEIVSTLSIALARTDPANAGDPKKLLPWQIEVIRRIYPGISEELKAFMVED